MTIPNRFEAGNDLKARLKAEARQLGFLSCGVTTADELDAATRQHFSDWLAREHHDRMDYLARDPGKRARPAESLPGARSVICLAAAYAADESHRGKSSPEPGFGRVARYARGRNYHRVLDQPLKDLERWLVRECGPDVRARCFCDAGPLMERQFAERAGLGFIGRHTLLITPEAGSWVLLAAIVATVEIPPDEPGAGTCGNCTRCLDACPTQAFPAPGVLDARRCISNLTIERRGRFSPAEARAVGDWVFGCDICQEVCPYNKDGATASFPDLEPVRFPQGAMRLTALLDIPTGKAFEREYGDSPLERPRLKGMRRNAAAVAGNQGDLPLAESLQSTDQ